jgi:hypothetical protein
MSRRQIDVPALNERAQHMGSDVERIAVGHNDTRILVGLNRTEPIGNA